MVSKYYITDKSTSSDSDQCGMYDVLNLLSPCEYRTEGHRPTTICPIRSLQLYLWESWREVYQLPLHFGGLEEE